MCTCILKSRVHVVETCELRVQRQCGRKDVHSLAWSGSEAREQLRSAAEKVVQHAASPEGRTKNRSQGQTEVTAGQPGLGRGEPGNQRHSGWVERWQRSAVRGLFRSWRPPALQQPLSFHVQPLNDGPPRPSTFSPLLTLLHTLGPG